MTTVTTKNGSVLLEELELDLANGYVDDICKAIAAAEPKYTISRQRLMLQRPEGTLVLQKGDPLSKYEIKKNEKVYFKDLGPQIDWRTVFLIEYLGPLLIHTTLYMGQSIFYAAPAQEEISVTPRRTTVQMISFMMIILHYFKRELETVHLHRFSNDTMPLGNLPKNCFHYWVIGGIMIAYPLYQPGYEHGYFKGLTEPMFLGPLLLIWLFAEVSNLMTHITLRNLRPVGTRVRNIPMGYGFNHVTCPNYFFEILGWIVLSLITGSLAVWFFTIVGAVQMYFWAVKKHKRYIKEFGDKYPRRRKILIPYII
ncbi:Very-long-chain enoyl-CoA reductase [Batrachochytrium dendrobatidis]|nr:Very-long-chain enoyl-CoA reductase [Batrachochytrium dendrobatidis]